MISNNNQNTDNLFVVFAKTEWLKGALVFGDMWVEKTESVRRDSLARSVYHRCSRHNTKPNLVRFLRGDHAHDEECNDVEHFDHRIDSGAGRVLVRIADGVARHRCLVRVAPFPAEVSLFDVLLCVVPCAAAGCRRNGNEESRHDASPQESAERFWSEN